jgi:hypothetical protein
MLGVQSLVLDHGLALRIDDREIGIRAGQYGSFLWVQTVEPRGTLG